jgi:predicted nucleic acid-binding protein
VMQAILDTGPWVALIDKSESRHEECVHWLKNYKGRLYTTEAVLTEVLYLLNFSVKAQTAAIDFVLESIIQIVPADVESLGTAKTLMNKYADIPMDFADATLVKLASDSGIHHIVTFDRRDFSIYRIRNTLSFTILP